MSPFHPKASGVYVADDGRRSAHAFIFLALAVTELLNFTRLPVLVEVVGLGVAIWILVYATRAFRYVYGGSLARTLLKELGIGAIYGSTSIVAFIVMFYWVSIAS